MEDRRVQILKAMYHKSELQTSLDFLALCSTWLFLQQIPPRVIVERERTWRQRAKERRPRD
jgi:hypothetical protein